MTNIWCFCLLKLKYVTILGRDNQKLIKSINRIWRINICELRWRNEHWKPPSACCASPASCAANWANELTEATVMDVYKENSCYIKLHQLTLLITREETSDQSQRQRRASQQRRHSRVAVTELYATYQTPSVIHLMCVCDRQEGGAVGYLATQCACVIDQVINEMPIMSENTNRNRRHRRENTTCISGHEHKHHRSFSRFFFILLSSISSSITDHYKYTKTPTDSSGLTPPLSSVSSCSVSDTSHWFWKVLKKNLRIHSCL